MLKVSILGILRIGGLLTHTPVSSYLCGYVLAGACLASVMALVQIDLKSLIAFSPVCHIAVPVTCLLLLSSESVRPSLTVGLGHGFVSACLFSIGSLLCYTHATRNMLMLRGVSCVQPSIVRIWCLVTIAYSGLGLCSSLFKIPIL